MLLVVWFVPIHTGMSHPLGVGHSGDWACKGCCLGGLFYCSNTQIILCNTIVALAHYMSRAIAILLRYQE